MLKVGWETLVEAGYGEETCYFELFHELKGVADLINSYGVPGMLRRCSLTAQYGAMLRENQIINEAVREQMREILREIEDGSFAQKLIMEGKIGYPNYLTLLSMEDEHGSEMSCNGFLPNITRSSVLFHVLLFRIHYRSRTRS